MSFIPSNVRKLISSNSCMPSNIRKFVFPKQVKFNKNTPNARFLNTNINVDMLLRDSDKDGKRNMFDCFPFDKNRHSARPNKLMRERLDRLPLYTTSESFINRATPKKAPSQLGKSQKKTRNKVYSMFKKYPSLISNIEKNKPRAVIFTEGKIIDKNDELSGVKYNTGKGRVEKGKNIGKGLVIVSVKNEPYKKKQEDKYTLYHNIESAQTTEHELEHIRQSNISEKSPQMAAKYSSGKYDKRLEEKLARKKEEELRRSRIDIIEKEYERAKEKGYKDKESEEQFKEYKEKQKVLVEKNFRSTFEDEEEKEE